MKKVATTLLVVLLFAMPAAADPPDGAEHYCWVNQEIIIIWSVRHDSAIWYLGEKVNPEGDQLPWLRLPVKRCPECGCRLDRSYCYNLDD